MLPAAPGNLGNVLWESVKLARTEENGLHGMRGRFDVPRPGVFLGVSYDAMRVSSLGVSQATVRCSAPLCGAAGNVLRASEPLLQGRSLNAPVESPTKLSATLAFVRSSAPPLPRSISGVPADGRCERPACSGAGWSGP